MVPGAGLEPARPYERGILNPLCLPISPPGHRGDTYKNCKLVILKHFKFLNTHIHECIKWCPGPDLNRHVLTNEGF